MRDPRWDQIFIPGGKGGIPPPKVKLWTGSQVFLKLPVCSVNNDILLVFVAFIILQMSDFTRLALDVYVFYKIWQLNTKKIQT